MLSIVGHNFLSPNYRKNWLTFMFYAIIAVTVVAQINSILNYDPLTKIVCSVGVMMSVQVFYATFILRIGANHSFFFTAGSCEDVSHPIHR